MQIIAASNGHSIENNFANESDSRIEKELQDYRNHCINNYEELIKEIIERDKDIDDLYINIVNTTYLIDNDPFVAGQAHLAARHLERIGDHISNIAESVYYYLTGEHYDTFD